MNSREEQRPLGLCSAVPTPEREKKMLICVARAHESMLRAQSLGTDQALNEVIAQAQFATALLDPANGQAAGLFASILIWLCKSGD